MSISELRDRARKELLGFAWSQWAQLGLSAHSTRSDRWVADPEALALFTAEVARRDPRLFDELLDWLSLNGRLLSLQRLHNLVPRFPIERHLVDAIVAWATKAAPSLQWRKPEKKDSGERPSREPLFSPDVVSFVGEPDPAFAQYGYVRPKGERSGKSSKPDIRATINLGFRLRLLFGVGTRSEVMRILLTFDDGWLDAAHIAEEAGFAKRNVSETLTALVEAETVKARWSNNKRVYRAPRDRWATFLELEPSAEDQPSYISWVSLLPALAVILQWLDHESESDDSEYLASSRARDLIERIAPNIEAVGVATPRDRSHVGAAYLPAFQETVESLLALVRST